MLNPWSSQHSLSPLLTPALPVSAGLDPTCSWAILLALLLSLHVCAFLSFMSSLCSLTSQWGALVVSPSHLGLLCTPALTAEHVETLQIRVGILTAQVGKLRAGEVVIQAGSPTGK